LRYCSAASRRRRTAAAGGAASAAAQEQRRGLGPASGLDQRLGAVLLQAPLRRLAGDREAVQLGGVVEGEGLAGRVGGGGRVLDRLVDATAACMCRAMRSLSSLCSASRAWASDDVAAAQRSGSRTAGRPAGSAREGRDRRASPGPRPDEALAAQLGDERAQVALPGARRAAAGTAQRAGDDRPARAPRGSRPTRRARRARTRRRSRSPSPVGASESSGSAPVGRSPRRARGSSPGCRRPPGRCAGPGSRCGAGVAAPCRRRASGSRRPGRAGGLDHPQRVGGGDHRAQQRDVAQHRRGSSRR
jgi:hypothetical protein